MARSEANALLLLAAFLWGAGNVAQKTVLLDLGPFTTFGLRGLIGLLVITPFLRRDLRRDGIVSDIPLFLGPSLTFCLALGAQQIAYLGTSVTNASFLVNTTVLFTPFVGWILLRERPGPTTLSAAGIAVTGVALMAGGFHGVAWGDVACLVSALLYSVWIVLVASAMRRSDRPFLLAASQFAITAVVGLAAGAACETVTLSALQGAAPELMMLGVLSTGAAFALQAVAQRWTPASDAAIVMSAESVFGAVAAALVLDERLSTQGFIGAAMIVGAIVLVQRPSGVLTSGARE